MALGLSARRALSLEIPIPEKEGESAGENPDKDDQVTLFGERCFQNQIIGNRAQQDASAKSHDEADCAPRNGQLEREEPAYQE
jgi:hypothetical protein